CGLSQRDRALPGGPGVIGQINGVVRAVEKQVAASRSHKWIAEQDLRREDSSVTSRVGKHEGERLCTAGARAGRDRNCLRTPRRRLRDLCDEYTVIPCVSR